MAFENRTAPSGETTDSRLLDDALRQTAMGRGRGARSLANSIDMSEAKTAIRDLKTLYGESLRVGDVSRPMLRALRQKWGVPAKDGKKGLPLATITRRFEALQAMGVYGPRRSPAPRPAREMVAPARKTTGTHNKAARDGRRQIS